MKADLKKAEELDTGDEPLALSVETVEGFLEEWMDIMSFNEE